MTLQDRAASANADSRGELRRLNKKRARHEVIEDVYRFASVFGVEPEEVSPKPKVDKDGVLQRPLVLMIEGLAFDTDPSGIFWLHRPCARAADHVARVPIRSLAELGTALEGGGYICLRHLIEELRATPDTA